MPEDVWYKMSSQNKALWIILREENATSAKTSEKNGGRGGYGGQYEQSANRSSTSTATTAEVEPVSEGDTVDDSAGNIWKVVTAKKAQRNQKSMKNHHKKKASIATVAQNTLLMRETRHIPDFTVREIKSTWLWSEFRRRGIWNSPLYLDYWSA